MPGKRLWSGGGRSRGGLNFSLYFQTYFAFLSDLNVKSDFDLGFGSGCGT